MKNITVFVIEDNAVTNDLLVAKLRQTKQITVEAFSSVESALDKISMKPAFILLDNFLDGANGIDSIPKIKSLSPDSKVIVLSNQSRGESNKIALDNGASAFFKKDGEGILSAIAQITDSLS